MKSEEKSIQVISAQAHSEAADNRLLRKKLQARDKRLVELEAMVSNLKAWLEVELPLAKGRRRDSKVPSLMVKKDGLILEKTL